MGWLGRTSILVLLFAPGCATSDSALRSQIFWEAAAICESRHRTVHVDQIDSEGNVAMHSDAESRMDLIPFNDCYREQIRAKVEDRRKKGLPVPEMPETEPSAELD